MLIKIVFLFFSLATAAQSTLEEYSQNMEKQKNPLTLVIGCGHKDRAMKKHALNHQHLDCWTVNLNENVLRINPDDPKIPTWKAVGADAPLDIAFMVYEKIFPETFGPYKHKFDVVVLEWVTKSTMVHPCTLYNALQMLKSGGTIVIDLHKSYNLRAYGRGMPLEELAGPDAQLLDPSSEEKPHKYLVAWLFSLGVENIVVQQGKESPYCPERAKALQEESAIITGLVSEIVHTNIQNNIEPYKKFFQTVQIDAKTPEQVFNLMNTPLNDDKHRALKRRLEKAKMTF